MDRIPLFITYRPALNGEEKTLMDLHSRPSNSVKHREVFLESSVIPFGCCKKYLLVRARVTSNNCDRRGRKSPDVKCVNLWLTMIFSIPT